MAASTVTEAVTAWNATLLPEDRHYKYCRMGLSPFIFYRASNHLFWQDFVGDRRLRRFGNRQTRTWLQGDMHLENMGVYHDSRGRMVYGPNDFDDAIIADYQFDVWRMAVSLVLVARQNGLDPESIKRIVDAYAATYLTTLCAYAGNDQAMHTTFTLKRVCPPLRRFMKVIKAEKTRKTLLKRWTQRRKRQDYFSMTPKFEPPIRVTQKLAPVSESERLVILAALPEFCETLSPESTFSAGHFEILDVAQRLLARTGSTGTPRYYILIRGRDKVRRILDLKLQNQPAAYSSLPKTHKAEFDRCFPNPAVRHAAAYRSLTAGRRKKGQVVEVDELLGWVNLFDETYSVRERSPRQATFPTSALDSEPIFTDMAHQWAAILATMHQRAHVNFRERPPLSDLAESVMALTIDKEAQWQELVCDVALSYADKVVQDWKQFKATLAPPICPPLD